MVNFYRRFISKSAQIQAPLNDLLQGNVKGKTPICGNQVTEAAFHGTKVSLAQAALLAHPRINVPLAIFCDASDFTVGAALQQLTDDGWEPLAFFSRKLNTSERKYLAYDRKLLAIYETVKHILHMFEARDFSIYTDDKPLMYAF